MQIHAELTITPAAHLMAAARATFQCLLSSFAFPKKVCPHLHCYWMLPGMKVAPVDEIETVRLDGNAWKIGLKFL